MSKVQFRLAGMSDMSFISEIVDKLIPYDVKKYDKILEKAIDEDIVDDGPESYVYALKHVLFDAIDQNQTGDVKGQEEVIADDEIPVPKVYIASIDDRDIGFGSYYQKGDRFFVGYWGVVDPSTDYEVMVVEGICDIIRDLQETDCVHIQIDNRFENEVLVKHLFDNLQNKKHDPDHILTGSRVLV